MAYVRFASVYRQFKDIDSFMEELTKLLAEQNQFTTTTGRLSTVS